MNRFIAVPPNSHCPAFFLTALFTVGGSAAAWQQDDGQPWRQYQRDVGYTWRGRSIAMELPAQRDRLEPLEQWKKYPALQLKLLGRGVGDEVLEQVARLDNLRWLMIEGDDVTDKGAEHLKRLKQLRELQLYGAKLSRIGLSHLVTLGNLEDLSLGGGSVERGALTELSRLGHLRHITLIGVKGIREDDLKNLAQIKTLESLAMSDVQVSDAGMAHLTGLSRLRILDLPQAKITHNGIVSLSTLRRLEWLRVSRDSQLNGNAIGELKRLPVLRTFNNVPLEVIRPGMAPKDFHRVLAKLEEPTTIEFMDTSFAEGLAYLSDLHDFPIELEDDVDQDQRTTRSISGIPLRQALNMLLDEWPLEFVVHPERILITDRIAADRRVDTRHYELAHLVEDETRLRQFVKLIPRCIEPNSWQRGNTPQSSLHTHGTRLTITQRRSVHRGVEKLLKDFGSDGAALRPPPGEALILKALEQSLTLQLNQVPLNEVVNYLRAMSGILIYVDRPAVKAGGISLEKRVSVNLKDTPVFDALARVLNPHELTWTVRRDVLMVTPRIRIRSLLQTRVYHVGELLTEQVKADEIAQRIKSLNMFADRPGRLVTACLNRIVMRATFPEHVEIQRALKTWSGR